jgi:hypothetical protein
LPRSGCCILWLRICKGLSRPHTALFPGKTLYVRKYRASSRDCIAFIRECLVFTPKGIINSRLLHTVHQVGIKRKLFFQLEEGVFYIEVQF